MNVSTAAADLVKEVSAYLESTAEHEPVTDNGGSSAKPILLPYGNSAAAECALRATVDLFAALPIRVRVLHVRETEFTYVGPIAQETEDEAQACAAAAVAKLRCHGITATSVVRRGGKHVISSLILSEAQQIGASVIVLGARPRRTLVTMIAGSISRPVLRHAECPVLLVHP